MKVDNTIEERALRTDDAPRPGGGRLRPVAIGLLALGLLAGGFLLGKQSSRPEGASHEVRVGTASTDQAGEAGETAVKEGKGETKEAGEAKERGKIAGDAARFTPEAMAEAGIRVEPVGYASVRSRLQATGAVEPNIAGLVKVTPRVGGKIQSVLVNVGDTVRAEQPLATLASTELAQAQAAYRQASARVAVAVNTLERQKKLAGLGAFGRPSVEAARTQSATVQGEINIAQNEAAAAQAAVAEAQSQVGALQAALVQSQTQVKVTESRFKRQEALLKEELTSRQDWEQAQADFQRAQADVDAARANLTQGQAKIETAKANLQAAQSRLAAAQQRGQIASQSLSREEAVYKGGYGTSKEMVEVEAAWRQAQLEQRAAAENVGLLGGVPGSGNSVTVRAPLAGRVTERLVSLGETVTPDKPLFTVLNLRTVWVQLNVYQKDLPAIHLGQAVTVTADTAPGRTFTGVVSSIGDLVDETTRTIKVRAVIQNAGNLLKPQTFVRGGIATDVRRAVLAVPKTAVQTYEGKTVVFVQGDQPGELKPREVQTGETVDGRTVIASGLKPGERVVTRGAFMAKAQAMKSELKDED